MSLISFPRKFSGCFSVAVACACSLFAGGFLNQARAEVVDTELLLLVDVSMPGLSQAEFDSTLASFAVTFTDTQVLNAIQSGENGSIAISLLFYGNAVTQVVGVPWMSIGNAMEAAQFASLVTNLTRPTSLGFSSPAEALIAGTESFGTETGNLDNGFQSSTQVIELVASGLTSPFGGAAAAVANASDAALASGVDLINATSVGFLGAFIEDNFGFFEANVIGSEIEGVEATSGSVPAVGALTTTLTDGITTTVETGAITSISLIPEPTVPLLAFSVCGLLLFRRERA